MLRIQFMHLPSINLHVGEKMCHPVSAVDSIAADCDEAQHIATMWPQFCPKHRSHFTIYGDMARQIMANW